MSPTGGFETSFAAVARVLTARVGLRLDARARGRLARCVTEEARLLALGLVDYATAVDSDPALLQRLLDRVTVQETSFFRDPKQCEVLAHHTFAQLREPVTVWSAGCANGQEAYTLAMLLEESSLHDWRVVATDLSRPALERTRQASYSPQEMAGVSTERRERHFTASDGRFSVLPSLRERVTAVRHNLVTEPPPFTRGEPQVVFCRNVLIYVGAAEVRSFLDKVGEWLAPDGWLFLGFSESLWQVSDRFRLEHVEDSYVYRPRDLRRLPANTATPAPPPPRLKPTAPPMVSSAKPRPRRAPAEEPTAATSAAALSELLATGEAAMRVGEFARAIAAFRKCAYLEPELPITHLHLGLALEGAGEQASAKRAFFAARAALERCDPAALDAALKGYQRDELARLLDSKLAITA